MNETAFGIALCVPLYALGVYAWVARLQHRPGEKDGVLFWVGLIAICIGSVNLYQALS